MTPWINRLMLLIKRWTPPSRRLVQLISRTMNNATNWITASIPKRSNHVVWKIIYGTPNRLIPTQPMLSWAISWLTTSRCLLQNMSKKTYWHRWACKGAVLKRDWLSHLWWFRTPHGPHTTPYHITGVPIYFLFLKVGPRWVLDGAQIGQINGKEMWLRKSFPKSPRRLTTITNRFLAIAKKLSTV